MGRPGRVWPEPPGSMSSYYLRLSVAPVIREHRGCLKGFGDYWVKVRRVLPRQMKRLQIIELKLCLLSAWISKYGEK